MIELAVTDLLCKAQLPELSYYQASCRPTPTGSCTRNRKWSAESAELLSSHENQTGSIETLAGESQRPASVDYNVPRDPSRYSPDGEDPADSSLVTAPMGSLYEVTQLGNSRETSPGRQFAPDRVLATDFISRGVIDQVEAEELFNYFDTRLNRYLWDRIAMNHKDLTSVRRSSSLLSAATLAVAALHFPRKERIFDTCFAEFARLASGLMLSRHHTFDDLRALCIGAFWLSDVSWKLSGYAVRIATERNVHQCYRKAIQGSLEHQEQARLWYLLYVGCTLVFSLTVVLSSNGYQIGSRASFLNCLRTTANHPRGPNDHQPP
jgi:hypothetical protein